MVLDRTPRSPCQWEFVRRIRTVSLSRDLKLASRQGFQGTRLPGSLPSATFSQSPPSSGCFLSAAFTSSISVLVSFPGIYRSSSTFLDGSNPGLSEVSSPLRSHCASFFLCHSPYPHPRHQNHSCVCHGTSSCSLPRL